MSLKSDRLEIGLSICRFPMDELIIDTIDIFECTIITVSCLSSQQYANCFKGDLEVLDCFLFKKIYSSHLYSY